MKRANVVNEEAFSYVKDGETKSLPARLINEFQVTQAIRVASTRRVVDHLKVGARSAEELVSLTQSNADAL